MTLARMTNVMAAHKPHFIGITAGHTNASKHAETRHRVRDKATKKPPFGGSFDDHAVGSL